jgi:hypothetical protein
MSKITKPIMILLAIFAVAFVILGYLDSSRSDNKIIYYTDCAGNKETIQDYNARVQINIKAEGPSGVNPGGLCLGEPVYGKIVTRSLFLPSLCTFAVMLALEIGLFFRTWDKKKVHIKARS